LRTIHNWCLQRSPRGCLPAPRRLSPSNAKHRTRRIAHNDVSKIIQHLSRRGPKQHSPKHVGMTRHDDQIKVVFSRHLSDSGPSLTLDQNPKAVREFRLEKRVKLFARDQSKVPFCLPQRSNPRLESTRGRFKHMKKSYLSRRDGRGSLDNRGHSRAGI